MAISFLEALQNRVLFLDGAMGTSIHNYDLSLADYNDLENCTEILVKTRPDVIQEIHESFLEAGADGVETDTFGGVPHVLQEFDLQRDCRELNIQACKIARAACDKYSTPDRPRYVIGSMGPGTKLLTLGQIDWDTMYASYCEGMAGLIEGGADVILIETCQDLLQVKCALNSAFDTIEKMGRTVEDLPVMVQVTIETMGTMLTGSEMGAAIAALRSYPIVSLGMNCATGPKDMTPYVQELGKHWEKGISILPNAGLPVLVEGRTEYPLKPQPFADQVLKFVDDYGLNIVGGCCGTTTEHIRALHETIGHRPAVKPAKQPMPPSCTSLYSVTEYDQDISALNVGERTNASGSRKFKRLLEEEDWDGMISLAREQMREGSHVIDVNVDYAGRNNAEDMATLVHKIVNQVDAPLMLDSTQPATLEAGLQQSGGKCIINSANLEDGEEKFGAILKLARKYGAAIVLGTIDEDPEEAMARTADRKISIASRMHKLATEKYGLAEEDIFFDPLVLPISTGMEKDRRSGLETIEGVRRIHEAFPNVQTTVGLSNISFGLKPAARQVLNSVFMHELREAGLTSAIVHASKILPRTKIPDQQWDAALDLIYDRREKHEDPLQNFIDVFPEDAQEQDTKEAIADLPLEERMQKHIIDGEKGNLEATLDEALEKYSPLEIINEHLLEGMKVVGELFGSGQMQLPFVLQSATVMKMAVSHLEPHMEKVEGQTKGKIVLATVRGDVHDIGKNLVDIILTNNGYTVYNMGIKQPVSNIIEEYKKTNADAIGLSGLLVKSVNIMEENLGEFNAEGINVPILLGGAALRRHYCESYLRNIYDGHVYHGQDAFEGLRIMDHLVSGKLSDLEAEIDVRLEKREQTDARVAQMQAKSPAKPTQSRSNVARDITVPEAPFWGNRLVDDIPLDEIYPFINKIALFRGQWQFKKGKKSDQDYQHQLEDEVEPIFERYKAMCRDENILTAKVVYGYYPVASSGNDLIVYDADDHDREVERFAFPRQDGKHSLCISDFFKDVESGEKDVMGLTCVTVGTEVSNRAQALFKSDNYTEYLYMHGFGVECAEALAELWHKRMRQELGIDGDDSATIRDLFTQKYRGSRYSFGYPACPQMSDQEKLFRLLKPERIGCTLTENWQIDPEQSTSAIVVHHPEAKYFNV